MKPKQWSSFSGESFLTKLAKLYARALHVEAEQRRQRAARLVDLLNESKNNG